jgi:outer membrane protein assembly factor BamB
LDGEIEASYDTDEWVWGAPYIDEQGMLYAADLAGTVYKLDAATLTDNDGWKVTIAEGAIRTTPLVRNEYVVVGSRDESVYWLDRNTGELLFSRNLDGEILADILFFPANVDEENAIEEDMVIVSTMSNREALVAFRAADGERIWTFRR